MNAVKKVAMVAMLATASGAFADIDWASLEAFPYAVSYGSVSYQKTAPVTLTGNTVSLDKVGDGMPARDTVAQVLVNYATVTAIPEDEWDDAVADYVTGTPQAAIGMMLKADGTTLVWKALTGAGTWTELTGTATEGTWCVKMEFDYTVNPVKVRYSVLSGVAGSVWTVLTANSKEWLSTAASVKTISGVDLAGVGTVDSANATSGARKAYAHIDSVADETSFDYTSLKLKIDVGNVVYGSDLGLRVDINNGTTTQTVTPTAENVIDLSGLVSKGKDYSYSIYAVSQTPDTLIPDSEVLKSGTIVYQTKDPTITENKITLNSNTQLALSSVSAGAYTVEGNYKLAWTDAGDRYATFANGTLTVIAGTPANGIPSYASYILGLDATDATKKPLIQTVPDALPGKFSFAVGNVGTVKSDLADVKYELGAADTPTATEFTKVGEGTDTIAVDIPSDAVKYYKLNILVTTK